MNTLTGFLFENHVAHGAFVEIRSGLAELLDHRRYSPDVRRLIGEALAAMPLLATHLNIDGRINLQFQGEGALKLLVAQVDNQLSVRAMAKAPEDLSGGFTELLYGGLLALMIEPKDSAQPASQALVLIQGQSLAEALEGYFARSEQLPTLIRLVASEDRVAGFMLQRLPLQSAQGTQDDWEHLETLAATLTAEELAQVDASTLLRRLFGNEALRTFEPRPVRALCRCSRDSVGRMLVSLGREEVDSIVAEQGQVEVTCEFCGRVQRFSGVDVGLLFSTLVIPETQTRH